MLIQNNNSTKNMSKSLTLANPTTIKNNTTQKNTFGSISASTASIGKVTTNLLHVKKNISSPVASIANINLCYDPVTNTSYVHNNSNGLIIKINNKPNSITVVENGDVVVGSNLNIVGNVNMIDGNFTGDIMANNADLLGDVTTTNMHVTNNFTIDGITTTNDVRVCNNAIIDKFLTCVQGINTNMLAVTNCIKAKIIDTDLVGSTNDLTISAGFDRSVNIPNVRYGVDLCSPNVINPIAIKSTKIFIVSQNIILQGDPSCDGIEIIIYNKNACGNIIIRDATCIIDTLPGKCAAKLVFICFVNAWIKL